ncbi:redoxin domain-containing protein [Streptomyces sp. NPDC058293]|uniref:redoxin domain-containing protein n=1 Tax=Streptomyces sp. NPDC058293 TaxID=3346429 RepID=UPI0036EA326E
MTVGAQSPRFALPSATGQGVTLDDLLADGPVVLTFYRGAWCPYCNGPPAAPRRHHGTRRPSGGHLSPQNPDESLSLTEKHHLSFDVLSDGGSDTGKQYGLAFDLPDDLAAV